MFCRTALSLNVSFGYNRMIRPLIPNTGHHTLPNSRSGFKTVVQSYLRRTKFVGREAAA